MTHFYPERFYPHATYTRLTPSSHLVLTPSPTSTDPVSWASLDPVADLSEIRRESEYDIQPIDVTVEPGDALYLPTGWWHRVSQSGADGKEGPVIAVNWWYDVEMR